jgi:non-ribosomal peptide synthase protein (TIGR01720 family)
LKFEAHDTQWEPGRVLTNIKEQLRRIPQHGLGYGVLRYLSRTRRLPPDEPPILVNYLGQLDQLVADSLLLRLAPEATGPWHSGRQKRRYPIELNCAVVGGWFEVAWTASRRVDAQAAVRLLNDQLLAALRELIAHCESSRAFRRTPLDFPLADLNQTALDRLVSCAPDLEDVYPLSPMQKLFISAARGSADAAPDQWHCTLEGPLDMVAFCDAWHDAVRRHPVLRSAVHIEHLAEPLQVVHRDVRMSWTIEDWRDLTPDERRERFSAFLERDRRWPIRLDRAPLMRFALIRLDDTTWKFCWSVAPLLLDGWSWPLVFADVSRSYEARQSGMAPSLDAVRPYREYIKWLAATDRGDAETFWRTELTGFNTPTPLPTPDSPADASWSHGLTIAPAAADQLKALARRLQVTVNAVVQAVWTILLGRQAGTSDVVFGAAFSGRPPDLAGADRIVGPLVTNVPVRVSIRGSDSFEDVCRAVHARLLATAPHQFLSLAGIQRVSEIGWRDRLFESLVVFQNYRVDAAASRVGPHVTMSEFAGPVHSGYPVMLLVEPSDGLRLTLIVDARRVSTRAAHDWAADLAHLLEHAARLADRPIAELGRALKTTPTARFHPASLPTAIGAAGVPPQTDMERTIADIWRRLCGVPDVGIDDNFLDMGGTSLLLVQFHDELRRRIAPDLSIVTLFAHATVRTLARALSPQSAADTEAAARRRLRAERQRYAVALRRERVKH